jgi:hypothetical protein
MTEVALTIANLSIHDGNGAALVDDVSLAKPVAARV